MEPAYSAQFQGLESAIKVSSNMTFFYLRKYTRRDNIWIPKSAQNLFVHISENPINSYDSDSVILISISVLGDKKRKLPFFCLIAFSRIPLVVSGRIIYRWKDILKGSTAHLEWGEGVQWGRRYCKTRLRDYRPS